MGHKLLGTLIFLSIISGIIGSGGDDSCSINGCGPDGCAIPSSEATIKEANSVYEREKQHEYRTNKRAKQQRVMPDNLESFDARKEWPKCESISQVHDQSACHSCYAVATASAITDRICIATGGSMQPDISASQLMSCCVDCWSQASLKEKNGCKSGKPFAAWNYWHKNGLVTGGTFASDAGCLPYQFPSCQSWLDKIKYPECRSLKSGSTFKTKACPTKCNASYKGKNPQTDDLPSDEQIFNDDKYFGKKPYCISNLEYERQHYKQNYEIEIKRELYRNGPMTALINVYKDLREDYKAGEIYVKESNKLLGGHAVKLIGWGREKSGDKYWLAMSSWGQKWGDDGVFKILMNQKDIRFESEVCAAEFDEEKTLKNQIDDD